MLLALFTSLLSASESPLLTPRDKFFDIACAGKNSVRIAGAFGRIIGIDDKDAWSRILPGNPTIYSLWFYGQKGWAVGAQGALFYSRDNGRKWSRLPAPTDESLFAVRFLNGKTGYVLGNFGTALRTQDGGLRWSKVALPYPKDYSDPSLNSIFFIDQSRGWIAGEFGLIFHTADAGRSWVRQRSGVNASLFKILFRNPATGYAVGMNGVILFTKDGGKNWKTIAGKNNDHLPALGLHKDKIWVGGGNGTLLKIENEQVERVFIETREGISSISFCPDQTGFIAGNHGLLLSSKDDGIFWRPMRP